MTRPLLPPDYGVDTWHQIASRLTALRNLGFSPRSILDVGAYVGHWATLANWIWPQALLYLVEGNLDCEPQLKAKGFPYGIAVLDSEVREVTYHTCQTGCGEGNGLFKENSVFPFTETKRTTCRLDDVVGERAFDLVKMDCQGGELRIIAGGERTVRAAHLVLLETQIQQYNEGAPLIDETIEWMGALGFRLYDIVEFHYNSRQMLLQADLLFAQATSPLFSIRPLS